PSRMSSIFIFSYLYFFTATATPPLYTLSLHDALPISIGIEVCDVTHITWVSGEIELNQRRRRWHSESEHSGQIDIVIHERETGEDRKSTRLNSSHVAISYAVFCLKKKNKNN